jgi:large repetitive protein
LNSIGNKSTDEAQLLTFQATASDSDIPANTLRVTLEGAVPAGAAIDPNNGIFVWTPNRPGRSALV